jgi:ubiquinone biosynthesis protein COQ4
MARIRPLIAHRALRALSQNPDDTAQGIVAIAALTGNSNERLFRRFKRSEKGREILRQRRDLYALLSDHERMLAMPPGSLGRTIVEWFIREDISAQGLAAASEQAAKTFGGRSDVSDEARVFGSRVRNLHDVFHVVAGYDRDVRGEIAVLTFTFAQTGNTGIGYLIGRSLLRNGWNSETGRLIRQAYQRGRRATWLLDADWETLFEQPIDQVREQLGVGEPPVYEQLRSAGAPPIAA